METLIHYCDKCATDIDFCTCGYQSASILKKEIKRIKGTWTDYRAKILHDFKGTINVQNIFMQIEQLMAQGLTGYELFKHGVR